jgi:hypothetical protein
MDPVGSEGIVPRSQHSMPADAMPPAGTASDAWVQQHCDWNTSIALQ